MQAELDSERFDRGVHAMMQQQGSSFQLDQRVAHEASAFGHQRATASQVAARSVRGPIPEAVSVQCLSACFLLPAQKIRRGLVSDEGCLRFFLCRAQWPCEFLGTAAYCHIPASLLISRAMTTCPHRLALYLQHRAILLTLCFLDHLVLASRLKMPA